MYSGFSIQKADNGYILHAQSPILRADTVTMIFSTMEEVFAKIKELEGVK